MLSRAQRQSEKIFRKTKQTTSFQLSPPMASIQSWLRKLTSWAIGGELASAALRALGLNEDANEWLDLLAGLAAQDYTSIPVITILAAEDMNGALGAYSSEKQTIYLNRGWLQLADEDALILVLTEEYGHYLDARFNSKDAPGDEGAYFAALLLQREVSPDLAASLKREVDSGFVNHGGQSIAVEQAVVSWKNAISGNWSSSANWLPSLPAAADQASIILDGTYTTTLDTDVTVAGLTVGGSSGVQTLRVNGGMLTLTSSGSIGGSGIIELTSGQINGAGDLTIAGKLNWSGGSQSGSGKTIVSGALAITGNGQKLLRTGRTLETQGSTTWDGANQVRMEEGSIWSNTGTGNVEIKSDEDIVHNWGALGTINNAGTFRKTLGNINGWTDLGAAFNNTGTVDLQQGNLSLSAGGSSTGVFNVATGTELYFGSGTHNLAASVSLTGTGTKTIGAGGTTNLASGKAINGLTRIIENATLSISANPTLANLNLVNGALAGTGTVTLSQATWSGGSQSGSGRTIVSGALAITGNGQKLLRTGRTLETQGSTTWDGANQVRMEEGSVWSNTGTGNVEIRSDEDIVHNWGALGTINNAGTFRKTIGDINGWTELEAAFNNTGTVDVQQGSLLLNAGGSSAGVFNVATGAQLYFDAGTHNLAASVALTGAGTKTISGGGTTNLASGKAISGLTRIIENATLSISANPTLANLNLVNGALAGTGTVTLSQATWSGGSQSGSGRTIVSGALAITGNGQKLLRTGRTLETQGSTTWDGANQVRMEEGSIWSNTGTGNVEIKSDEDIVHNWGALGTINNAGTFRKTLGNINGWTDLGAAFNNTGTVDLQQGNLSLSAGGSSTGVFNVATGTELYFGSGTHNLAASVSLTGTGTKTIGAGGTTNLASGKAINGLTRIIENATLSISANPTLANLNLVNGALAGTGTVTLSQATWSGGSQSGSGKTIVSGPLAITGDGGKVLNNGRTLETRGSTTWDGTNQVRLDHGSIWSNTSTGNIEIRSDEALFNAVGALGTINNAGTVRKTIGSSNDFTTLEAAFNNTGTVDVQQGSLNFTGSYRQLSGTTRLSGGNIKTSSALNIQGGSLEGFGGINGSVNNGGSVVVNGKLRLTGDYAQSATGQLKLDINGATAGTGYDQLSVDKRFSAAGSLVLSLGSSFLPSFGDQFSVLNYASASGNFQEMSGLFLSNGMALMPVSTAQGTTLEVIQSLVNLGKVSPTLSATKSGSVSDSDAFDYYQFTAAGPSNISLKLSGMAANADIRLIDSLGRTIGSSNNTSTADDIVLGAVDPGVYFAQVVQSAPGQGTGYQLAITATDDGGNALDTALDLGTLQGTRKINDRVSSADPNDYFRFQLAADGTLNLSLTGETSGNWADFELLDSRGTLIRSSNPDININLQADTYYARVYQWQGSPSYQLNATFTPIADLAGHSLSSARNLSRLVGNQIISDFVGDIDREDFYRFELSKASTFWLTLNGLKANADVTLLNGQGQAVASGTNQGTTAESLIRELAPGTYYLKVHNSGTIGTNNTTYNLSVTATPKITPFQITGVSPASGSNAGETTLTIQGAQFTPQAKVSVIGPTGVVKAASQVTWENEGTLQATINLQGLSTGLYDVQVVDAAGTTSKADIFTVTPFNPGRLEVSMSAPEAMRPWWTGEVTVNYRNAGGTDIPAPLFVLNATGGQLREQGSSSFTAPDAQFLGTSGQGVAGVLRPGESGSQVFRFKPGTNVSEVAFNLSNLADNKPLDWASIKASSRPEQISPEAWEVIFRNFVAAVGGTTSSYQTTLGDNASRLSQLGEGSNDVADLLAFELQQASGSLLGRTQLSAVDAVAPTAGIGLAFGRSFAQAIDGRFALGAFGRGWSHPWEARARKDADGNVLIQGAGGFRLFRKQANGSFLAAAGDEGTLTVDASGYHIRELDGSRIDFRSDGRLERITDLHNTSVVAGYTGNQLTKLTHSGGSVLTLHYNAQGRIDQLTDENGDLTTYSYDASGQYLESVRNKIGTVGYTYNKTNGAANQHSIASITYPDGSKVAYSYDSQGLLAGQSVGTGSQAITYRYDGKGGITVTDAKNQSTQLLLNANGQVAQATDPLGRVSQFRYDSNGNLSSIIAPDGRSSGFSYDARGNVISSVDALGQRLEFTYDPRFDALATLKDQRGNVTTYKYDDAGNLRSITYPDNKAETFDYDALGNLKLTVNRRSQNIKYTYNTQGQLIEKLFADGKKATYTYEEGRLKTATDTDSSVVYDYKPGSDLLQKVSYNTGRSLTYTYDAANRLKSMTDQAGKGVIYGYGSQGRLETLHDQANQLIVRYSYDAKTGQLSREDNGNGTFTTYSYDAAGQLETLENRKADGTVNSRFTYGYDSLGRRTSVTTLEGKTTYDYDATGQLTEVKLPAGRTITYAYDAAGNRKTVSDSGATTTYSPNNLNQYTTVGGATYSYDLDGNLTRKVEGGQASTYSYDSENRLVGVTTPSGSWSYEYDALGNRIATVTNGVRTEYLVDPTGLGNVVGEYSNGTLVANYTHGIGLVSQVSSSGNRYYDSDAIGSTVALTGAGGSVLNRYSYLPFGEDLSKSETVANPFEYVGQWGVMDEGNGLDFMRARYFGQSDGRFFSQDPINIAGGDSNLYRYTGNDPLLYLDPSGFARCTFTLFANAGRAPILSCTSETLPTSVVISANENGSLEVLSGGGYPQNLSFVNNPTFVNSPNIGPVQPGEYTLNRFFKNYGNGSGDIWFGLDPGPIRNLLHNIPGIGWLLGVRGGFGLHFGSYSQGCITVTDKAKWRRLLKLLREDAMAGVANTLRVQIRNSIDPNDIIGPSGAGAERWLTAQQTLPYKIRFENLATATGPAVFVTVTHTLDSDLDLNTFSLGDFGFRNIDIDVPDGLQAYSTRVDLRSSIGYFVDLDAALNTSNRTVTWKLTTIDPITGELPMDVDAGFLPPNNANHDGEGYVNYTINAKAGLPTGTQIDSLASIVFDTNEPIATPLWRNTVDVSGPTSSVAALPAQSSPSFAVSWSGSDAGSGIASYDIYASTDGGPFSLWLDNTTATRATFNGQVGKRYGFYSVATDQVGYVEARPAVADASTLAFDPRPVITLAASPASLAEDGSTNLIYTFTRTGPTTNPLTVGFGVAGTATFNTDYTQTGAASFSATAGTVTFPAGSATAIVTVDPKADTTIEPNETVAFTLASGTGYIIGSPSAVTSTILNDDLPAITLAASPASLAEDGSTNLLYTFTRTGPTTNPLTVRFGVAGTATFNTDYTQTGAASFSATAGTVTFPGGSATAIVTVDPKADTTIEPNETVAFTLASGSEYTIGTASAVSRTILNDDLPLITLAASPSSVAEDGSTNLIYTFRRTGPTTNPLTVSFGIAGTATFNTDYTQTGAASFSATTGTVTFPGGSATAIVTVDPKADTSIEPNETVAFTLSSGTGYTIGTSTTVSGTISNDDPRITLAVSPASVAEDGSTNLLYTFTRSGATTNALTVSFRVAGTAAFGSDYTQTGAASFSATSGTIIFAAGSATAVVTVDPTPDTTIEPDETVALTLAAGTGYTVGTAAPVTGRFLDDDQVVTLSVSPGSVEEDGTTNLVYTFTRNANGALNRSLTVNYIVAGTAAFGTDYTQTGAASFSATSGTIIFAAGSDTAVVTVDPTPDTTIEPDETVALTLAAGTGYTVGTTAPVTGRFLDDDQVVTLSVSPGSVEEDGTTNLVYTFTRNANGALNRSLTVNYIVAGTAAFGTDYTQTGAASFSATSGTIIFAAGSDTAVVTVDPTPDTTIEPDETVALTLAAGSGYTIGTQAEVSSTSLNDDLPVITLTVSPASVAEDGGHLFYRFFRTGPAIDPLTVSFGVSGTASYGTDYVQLSFSSSFFDTSGTVKFRGGDNTADVIIYPVHDTTIEPDETVTLALVGGSDYIIGSPSEAGGVILTDDLPVINLAVSPASVLEDSSTDLDYTFTRTGPTTNPLTVSFGIIGRAMINTDYTLRGATSFSGISGTITFAEGMSTATVTIDPTGDATIEPNETVTFILSDGSDYKTGTAFMVDGIILNDDLPLISLAVSPASVSEDGSTNLDYTFTRTGPTTNPLTVSFGVAGTATFNTDYTQTGAASFSTTGGSITFASGASTAIVTVNPTMDTIAESNETVALTLAAGADYQIQTTSAVTGTVINVAVPTISLALSTSTVRENGSTLLTYSFTRTGATTLPQRVNFSVSGTADFNSDYTQSGAASFAAASGSVLFAAGSSAATITINPTADLTEEADETVAITLLEGADYLRASATALRGTILNDDQVGSASADVLTGRTVSGFISFPEYISGLGGNDTIQGGSGIDTLAGGAGADRFIYAAVSDSSRSANDQITDFAAGSDKIDLSRIDPVPSTISVNEAFTWLGLVSAVSITPGRAGYAPGPGGVTVFANTGTLGSTTPDVRIDLPGVSSLAATDFIL